MENNNTTSAKCPICSAIMQASYPTNCPRCGSYIYEVEPNNNTESATNIKEDIKSVLRAFDERVDDINVVANEIIDLFREQVAPHPEPMEVEKEGPWRYEAKTWGIADTGDYDGHYEITNGKITLICKDEPDEADVYFKPLITALNNLENIEVDEGPYWSAGFDEGMKVERNKSATHSEPAKENNTLPEDAINEFTKSHFPEVPMSACSGPIDYERRNERQRHKRNCIKQGMVEVISHPEKYGLSQHLNKKEVAEWISVEDGLPTDDKQYLCIGIMKDSERDYWNIHFNPVINRFIYGHENITHWMPLPSKPI